MTLSVSDDLRQATKNARAVLFDLDGTLLDTALDMGGALNDVRAELGLSPISAHTIRGFVSHGASALVRLGFPTSSEDEFSRLKERFLSVYEERLCTATEPFPGVMGSLNQLESHGIPWGIVTNKPKWLTEPLLKHFGLLGRVGVLVCGDTLSERKPHPLPLQYAAVELQVMPGQCIYIGDAERDVLAARAASMPVLVALFGYISEGELPREWPASGWLESPREMNEVLGWIGRQSSMAKIPDRKP